MKKKIKLLFTVLTVFITIQSCSIVSYAASCQNTMPAEVYKYFPELEEYLNENNLYSSSVFKASIDDEDSIFAFVVTMGFTDEVTHTLEWEDLVDRLGLFYPETYQDFADAYLSYYPDIESYSPWNGLSSKGSDPLPGNVIKIPYLEFTDRAGKRGMKYFTAWNNPSSSYGTISFRSNLANKQLILVVDRFTGHKFCATSSGEGTSAYNASSEFNISYINHLGNSTTLSTSRGITNTAYSNSTYWTYAFNDVTLITDPTVNFSMVSPTTPGSGEDFETLTVNDSLQIFGKGAIAGLAIGAFGWIVRQIWLAISKFFK